MRTANAEASKSTIIIIVNSICEALIYAPQIAHKTRNEGCYPLNRHRGIWNLVD